MNRLLCAVVALAFCVLSAPASAETRIAFINPGKADEFFWPEVTRTMQAAADQFGFQLEVDYAERDAQRMIRLGLERVQQADPPDFLVLVNEFQAAREILHAADARGIKVLMLLNAFVGGQLLDMGAPGEKYRHWIGSLVPNNHGAGQRMAASLVECMLASPTTRTDGKLHVLALAGDARTPASLERTAGMHAAFAAAGNVVIDRHFQTNWQGPDATRLTRNYLNWAASHQIQPAGIWAANDALAIGALDSVRNAGLRPGRDLCLVGLNWSPEAVDLVRDRSLAATEPRRDCRRQFGLSHATIASSSVLA